MSIYIAYFDLLLCEGYKKIETLEYAEWWFFQRSLSRICEIFSTVRLLASVTCIPTYTYGLHGRVARRKPYIRQGNRRKRLEFAKEQKKLTVEQWKNVLWNDESKIGIFSSKRRQYVRRRVGEQMKDVCLKLIVKHGEGSIMVWGCLTANGVCDLFRIDGIMNTEKDRQILIQHAISSRKGLIGNGFIFQQDNDHQAQCNKGKKLFRAEGTTRGCSSYRLAFSKSRLEYHRVFVGLFEPKEG